jgi:hypothetical protein
MEKKYFTHSLLLLIFSLLGFTPVFAQQAGSLDMSFNPNDKGFGQGDGFNGSVLSSAFQADGKILIT